MSSSETGTPWAVAEYLRCINEEDWAAFANIWTDDAILLAVGARPRQGKADVMAYYPLIFGFWAEHHDHATRVIVAGDAVTAEIHFHGVTKDGVAAEFDALDLFDLAEGKIARLSNWYDLVAARKAVGMA